MHINLPLVYVSLHHRLYTTSTSLSRLVAALHLAPSTSTMGVRTSTSFSKLVAALHLASFSFSDSPTLSTMQRRVRTSGFLSYHVIPPWDTVIAVVVGMSVGKTVYVSRTCGLTWINVRLDPTNTSLLLLQRHFTGEGSLSRRLLERGRCVGAEI